MSATPPHLLAQQAVVRMLHDPAFAARVRAAPDAALPELPPELRQKLAAIDPRALAHDRLRGRRLLRTLFDEFKASTTWALAVQQKLAFLDRFFATDVFAEAVAGHHPLYAAYGFFLVNDGGVPVPLVNLERMLADARRRRPPPRDGRVWRAPGVETLQTSRAALAALQAIEQYLFEVSLMPAVALCDDAPSLPLPTIPRDAEPLWLVTVPGDGGAQSIVEIDEPLHDLLESLPRPFSPALQPLLDDELAVRA